MLKYLFILLVLVISCQPTELEEIEIPDEIIPPKTWIKHPFFTHSYKWNLHSYSNGDHMLIRGPSAISSVRVEGDTLEYRRRMNSVTDYGFEYKIPMNENVIVTIFDFNKSIEVTCNGNIYGKPMVINMEEFDSTFTSFNFPKYRKGKAILNTKNSKLVIPYFGDIAKILIIEYLYENCNSIKLLDYTIVERENSNSLRIMRMLELSNGNILVSGLNGLHHYTGIIDGDNQYIEAINLWIDNFFEYNGQYFGLVFDDFYYSEDGFNWELVGQIDSNFRIINYLNLGNKLIGYWNSQIFEFEFSRSEIKVWELDNEGLEGHSTTSINQVGDYVFVSTLSGVFYKHQEDFFNLREMPDNEKDNSGE